MAQFYSLEEAARVLGMSAEELKAKAQHREVRAFLADNNPAALAEIAARFAEAVERGLWSPRSNSAWRELQTLTKEEVA